jgi:hypothetical protein
VHDVDRLPLPQTQLTFGTRRRQIYGTNCTYTGYYDQAINGIRFYACFENEKDLYINFVYEIRDDVVFDGLDLPPLLLKKGVGILHCSYIEVNGGAILFSGDKQVGKSTQAALWEKYANATVLNGDRAGIYLDNGIYFADGVPFCGTSKICVNKKLPIRAIICLSQGKENHIQRLLPVEGYMQLLGQFAYYSRPADFNLISNLLQGLCENVPIYHYSCVKDESAVDTLKQELCL